MPRLLKDAFRLLLRLGLCYAAAYLLWLPLRPAFMRLMAAMARGWLALLDPSGPVVGLAARGDVIAIHGGPGGADAAIATWSGVDLHFFVVATLAFAAAAPVAAWSASVHRARALRVAAALAVAVLATSAICTLQVMSASEIYYDGTHRLKAFSPAASAFIAAGNRLLIMVGMLLIPSVAFLAPYVATRLGGGAGGTAAAAATGMPYRRRSAAAPLAAIVLAGCVLAALVPALAAAIIRQRGGDPGEARRASLHRLLALNPGSAQARFLLGVAHEQAGNLKEAARFYGEALDLDPGHVEARLNHGNALYAAGDFGGAAASYRHVLGRDPGHVWARYNLGNALFEQADYVPAAAEYEAALRLDPRFALAHKNLAITLIRLDRPCDGLTHLQRGSNLDRRVHQDPAVASEIARLQAICPARQASGSRASR